MPRLSNLPLMLLAVIALGAAMLELFWLRGLTPLENRLSDFFIRDHAPQLAPDPDIIIVDIDEASLARMVPVAGNWPWPRAVHGELAQGIARQKPKAIVFDIQFSEPDTYRRESDAYLDETVGKLPNVYFPLVRDDPKGDARGLPMQQYAPLLGITLIPGTMPSATLNLRPPYALSPQNWRTGLINYLEDADGIGRRYYLHLDARGWRIPSLPARIATDLGYIMPRGDQILLGWRGGAYAFQHVSYAELYEDFSRQQPRRDPHEFRDKIVIIGAAASGLHDLRATPVTSLYPGVEILATALDNLKNQRYMHATSAYLPPLLAALLISAMLAAFLRHYHPLLIGSLLAAVSAILLGASYLAIRQLALLPVLTPLLFAWAYYFAAALHEHRRERKAREQTVRIFNRFLDPRVVKQLVDQGQTASSLSGQSRVVTVLFSDIRGFTTLSETQPPQDVVDLLNRYFSMQVEVIFRHGGTLDKFIGDAIMAFWNAPTDDPEHARHAVEAALEMSDKLEEFRQQLGEAGKHFDVGIGIHSGPAVVGFIGSARRQDYTAIGDTVNLASRIEGETKGRSRILASEETARLCGETFDFQDFGLYKVKGRTQEVRLFQPKRKHA